MGGIMYRTENLNKSYADGDGVCYALKDVNLDISKGQMVAIVTFEVCALLIAFLGTRMEIGRAHV